jgi:hypothetical protein
MCRVILALLVVSAGGVDIDETLSLLQVRAAVTDEVEKSETSCPDLGGFYTTDWYRTIDTNMNAGKAWYNTLPGNWWYGMSGPQAKEAIHTRCCPSLGDKTAAQWAASIDGNTAAGSDWYLGLPETWWYGMTGEQAKNVIESQCSVKSEAECSAQGGNAYAFCGGLNYCQGPAECSGERQCGNLRWNACFGQAASPTPAPTPSTTTATTTTTTTVVSLDGLDDEESDDENTDQQVSVRECKGWCSSNKHDDRAWTGVGGKCNWFACSTCPECSA